MRKIFYLISIMILPFSHIVYGQNIDAKEYDTDNKLFSLTISTYNHAEQIFNGTLTYSLTKNQLKINRSNMFADKDTLIFTKPIDKTSIDKIKKIRLDNLQDNYFNNCIMITSGNEYFISTTNDTISKTIHLHHYYETQIEKLIIELNKQIPKHLKIDYLTSKTKQNCK